MPEFEPADPVTRVAFASTSAEEVEDYIARMYVGNRITFGVSHGPAGFSASYADAGPIAADKVACSIDYSGSTEPWDSFCSWVLDRGQAHVWTSQGELRLTAGDTVAYPLGVRLDFEMLHAADRVVRLPLERLDQAAESLGVPRGQLRWEGGLPVSAGMARYWRHLLGLVNGALMEPESLVHAPLLLEELTQLTALAALHTFPNSLLTSNYTPGPGKAAPAVVRRAVAHIEANANRPLSLDEIAQAAGVGTRALQSAFRRHLDTTPLAYLRRVRLEHARRDLQAAERHQGATVAAIARRWGFAKPSRFAADYHAAFGELPSHTLRN